MVVVSPAFLNIEWIGGPCPMQAWGRVDGDEFFFRARWDQWSFAVSQDPNVAPDEDFPEQCFVISQPYGKGETAAGYMPESEARTIIQKCAAEYCSQKHKLGRFRSPAEVVARRAFAQQYPELRHEESNIRAEETGRFVVAILYSTAEGQARPCLYKLYAVALDLSAAEELPCTPDSPYWIKGRK